MVFSKVKKEKQKLQSAPLFPVEAGEGEQDGRHVCTWWSSFSVNKENKFSNETIKGNEQLSAMLFALTASGWQGTLLRLENRGASDIPSRTAL